MAADICPATRKRCPYGDVCRMMWCGKGGRDMHPISERELTRAERYALAMADRKALAALDGKRG